MTPEQLAAIRIVSGASISDTEAVLEYDLPNGVRVSATRTGWGVFMSHTSHQHMRLASPLTNLQCAVEIMTSASEQPVHHGA